MSNENSTKLLSDAEIESVTGGSAWDDFWYTVGEAIAEGLGNLGNAGPADSAEDAGFDTSGCHNQCPW